MSATTLHEPAPTRKPPPRPTVRQRVWAAFNPDVELRSIRPWHGAAAQLTLIVVATLLYLGVRALTQSASDVAFLNAKSLVDFEATLGLNFEEWAQQLIIDVGFLVTLFNWVYIWFHWPVILFALFFLYRRNKGRYVLIRNAMFISGAIGLVFFLGFPVAPPRFVDGFTDTVTDLSSSYKVLQNPAFVNEYAALPSFHVGWNVLAGIGLFKAAAWLPLKVFAIASPTLMSIAVVLTANHWVIDGIVGTGVALIGLAVAYWIRQRTHAKRAALATG